MGVHCLQASFSGGEVSPAVQARIDSPAYSSWLKTARNFFVHPQGGASNRPGTIFMGQAKYKDKPCRVIPFVLGENESYVLEFGEKYLRIYTPGGQLLTAAGAPYELATPYLAAEVAQVNYAQYDQTLFLVHSNYPPKQLTRLTDGTFELKEVPLKYGPFMLSNTDESKKLRLIPYNEAASSDGVKATLTFQPIIYPNLAVLGYFNNVWFYSGKDYGFDIAALVSAFNQEFGAQGFSAVNLGGIIKIESPQATGGACNGLQLVLEYRNSFTRPAVLTVAQALSGGANKGELIPSGENKFLLESDFDFFQPGHTGGKFALTHAVESQYLTGTLGYQSVSKTLKSGGSWQLRTSGVWSGQLVLEKSADGGKTWKKVKYFSRADGEENFNALGHLEDTADMYYLRVSSNTLNGEAGFELQADAFIQEGIVTVEGYLNARQAVVRTERQVAFPDWTDDWAEGSFSPLSGYPACVFFYQDRLGLAGTRREAQTVWFSKTGAHCDFGHSRDNLAANDAISVNLSGKKLNAIHGAAVCGRLMLFTAGSEWTLSSSGALTPTNIQVAQQGERGASRTAPILVGNRALFVQARGGCVRDLFYDYNTAAYIGNDLTLLAKHLFFNREVAELCYQQEPDNLVWCVLDDGTALTLTYLPEQNLCAWTRHDTQGLFKSVCCVPNRGYDEVWFVVARQNGYFVERLARRLASKEPQDQVFLDASVSLKSETPFTRLGGLSHLEGLCVGVLADGNVLSPQVVKNGEITLPRAVTCAHAGLLFTAELATLPPALVYADGTAADRKKRFSGVSVKLLDSRGGQIGTDETHLTELLQRTDEPFNAPIALKTGDYVMSLSGSHTLSPSVIFRQTDPLPVTLLSLITR
ncbi:MAG: hypothetical protein EGQ14_03045 [Spirochaetia bacterium]|uniref:phage nozzle protein n=1 Tax=Candidatus Avelusimicrobium fimicolum TaxID=3416216 RepID=UPI003CA1106D|nr:hypothetical protein [Spirochaetia bacterium]